MSKGNATVHGYYLEARCFGKQLGEPPQLGPTYLSSEWRRIPTFRVRDGGIGTGLHDALAEQKGMMSYVTGKALMAAGAVRLGWKSMGVEFRLSAVKLTYEWSITEEGTTEPVCLFTEERTVRKNLAIGEADASKEDA